MEKNRTPHQTGHIYSVSWVKIISISKEIVIRGNKYKMLMKICMGVNFSVLCCHGKP